LRNLHLYLAVPFDVKQLIYGCCDLIWEALQCLHVDVVNYAWFLESSTMVYQGNKWLVSYREDNETKLNLFCFPYAGGNAAAFKSWVNYLPKTVNLVAIELPGHGIRLSEKPIENFKVIIDNITKAALPLLSKPYVVFGHSMGAIFAFEFTRHLRQQGISIPMHMFLSAQEGARFKHSDPKYLLPDDEFIEYLRKKSGTLEKVLASRELMDCLLPMLRLDHKFSETYYVNYQENAPLNCPITVFAGVDDDITEEALKIWSSETLSQFDIEYFSGDHFFIRQREELVISAILKRIEKYI
jgi:medium-chain acyl-[acyl-carrier-protein] hydrolase